MNYFYIKGETISICDSGWTFDFIKIAKVLRSVIDVFDEVLMHEYCLNIKCSISYKNTPGPQCRFIPNTFSHEILLTAHRNSWPQYVYQFAHEYCHHLTSALPIRSFKGAFWFEEVLCETASFYCLSVLQEKTNDVIISTQLGRFLYGSYLNDLYSDTPKLNTTLGLYIKENIPYMETPSYQREKYSVIARNIVDIFLQYPKLWNIILFIRKTQYQSDRYTGFYDFLDELEGFLPESIKFPYSILRERLSI